MNPSLILPTETPVARDREVQKGDRLLRVTRNKGQLAPFAILILSFCAMGSPAAEPNTASFAASRVFYTGGQPLVSAMGDFNGDGKLDLAVANRPWSGTFTNRGVAVLLGKGDGTFHDAMHYGTGDNSTSVAVADFNRDGKLDLAVANSGSYDAASPAFSKGTVSVLLGNGDGTFQRASSYDTGIVCWSVATGDFNNDGMPDLVVANHGSGTNKPGSISLLLGNGDGTFRSADNFTAGLYPLWIAVGEFNSDGKLDVVVANQGDDGTNGSLSVMLGNGDGTFQHAIDYNAGSTGYSSVAVADFNGDGKPDLAASSQGSYAEASRKFINSFVSVFFGKGDGTFQPAVNISTGSEPWSVAARDLNGDGKVDLVAASFHSGSLSVLLGKGDGSFLARIRCDVLEPWSIAVEDLDNDGKPDVVLTNPNLGNVSVIQANGDGTFRVQNDFFPVAADYHLFPGAASLPQLAVGDFNGDKSSDLLVSGYDVLPPSFASLAFLSDSDGILRQVGDYVTEPSPSVGSFAVGDFNGDGKADLFYAQRPVDDLQSSVGSALLGKGDGTFISRIGNGKGAFPVFSFAGADFNGDGNLDVCVADPGLSDGSNVFMIKPKLWLIGGNSDGTFQQAIEIAAPPTRLSGIATSDFNGDGKPDLALTQEGWYDELGLTSTNAGLMIFLNKGGGNFSAATNYSTGSDPRAVAAGDFNGDGRLDLAVANAGSPDESISQYVNGGVSILLGRGDGSFQPSDQIYHAQVSVRSVALADFNGDGRLDLAAAGYRYVSLLFGNGDGTFAEPIDLASTRFGDTVVVGDFNHDRKPDLAVTSQWGVLILLNRGASARPKLSISRSAAGLLVSVEGPANLDYTIQSSTDLITWREVTKISNAQSSKVILDGLPTSFERQFYRAVSQ